MYQIRLTPVHPMGYPWDELAGRPNDLSTLRPVWRSRILNQCKPSWMKTSGSGPIVKYATKEEADQQVADFYRRNARSKGTRYEQTAETVLV